MSSSQITTKTVRGKYQLSKNIFVTCYLDILEATDREIRTFIGLKQRADTQTPVGTKIFLDAELLNKQNYTANRTLDIFSATVMKTEAVDDKFLHICTPMKKETRSDMRSQERLQAEFPVRLVGADMDVWATGGTAKGLTLHCNAKSNMLRLSLSKKYEFAVTYKEKEYTLEGDIKHVQYDWKSHEHIIGVHFPKLPQDQEVILNLLLDPNYTVQIQDNQTVDTAAGKISFKDLD